MLRHDVCVTFPHDSSDFNTVTRTQCFQTAAVSSQGSKRVTLCPELFLTLDVICFGWVRPVTSSLPPPAGLQSRLSLLLHGPLQQPDVGHHLQQLLCPEQREHAGRPRRGRQRRVPLRQQHAHQQRVHRHEPGQRQPRDPQGGHPVRSGPRRQRQDRHV